MTEDITKDRYLVEQIARTAHEVNRVYCNSLGDYSQAGWDIAPASQKESSIKGVLFALQNPDVTPEEQHNSWMKDKIREGWVYGPQKDPDKKTHPCLLEYGSLPAEQRLKDELFLAVVRSFDNFIV